MIPKGIKQGYVLHSHSNYLNFSAKKCRFKYPSSYGATAVVHFTLKFLHCAALPSRTQILLLCCLTHSLTQAALKPHLPCSQSTASAPQVDVHHEEPQPEEENEEHDPGDNRVEVEVEVQASPRRGKEREERRRLREERQRHREERRRQRKEHKKWKSESWQY